jgi:IS30 family transposase
VERKTGSLILVNLTPRPNRVYAVHDGLIRQMVDLPNLLRQTLTWDQNVEMHRHKEVTIAADLAIHFCDPHSPWQRPRNENANGLLEWTPKGTDLGVYSQEDLEYVAWEMNDCPSKRLDYLKPNETIAPLMSR